MQENPLTRKLKNFTHLNADEERALDGLCAEIKEINPRTDIISEGDRPECVHLVLDGWAARYKLLPDGDRQITAFLIPGDFCDIHITILERMDHAIAALSPCTVAYVPSERLDQLTQENSNLTRALWWSTLLDEAVLREWVINNGKRSAIEAMAHIICEMHVRMEMVGLVEDGEFAMPITQEDLSAATGLTPVHANRVLKALREKDLVEFRSKQLTVRDIEGLRDVAGFETAYFHLRKREGGPS